MSVQNPVPGQVGQVPDAMQAMLAGQFPGVAAPVVPGSQPTMVMPEVPGIVAPVLAPAIETVAPVAIQTPVVETPVMPAMVAPVETPAMPAMAPVVETPAMAPAPAPAAQVAAQAQMQVPVQNIGTQANISNGLDLDDVMTPEAEVTLAKAEVEAKPIVINGLQSIGSCKVSVWSALITILDFIAKGTSNNDIISIEKGTIDTHRDGIFIHCNMQNILGNISLNLTSPDTSVKLLKLIRGGELIQIFKEEETNSYVFCNIQDGKPSTKVKTTFAHEAADGFGKAPVLGNPIFQKEIPQNEREIVKTIIAGKAAISSDEPYRFGFSKTDNSLVSIGVGKNFTHYFQDSTIEVDEYRVFNPFPVPNMESIIIRFFKKADDNTCWIQTVSNINVSSIVCTEKVELIDSSIEDFNFNA